jgi:hypothetical protein
MVKYSPGDATLGVVIHSIEDLCSSILTTSSNRVMKDEIGSSLVFEGRPEGLLRALHPDSRREEESLKELGRLLTSLSGTYIDRSGAVASLFSNWE